VAIDPTGAWHGLRSSADGKKAGYPIVVFGGDQKDVLPLEETAGEVIARAIVECGFSAILDLSELSENAKRRFATSFAETLYHLNRNPLHLFMDEADEFAPQKAFKGTERLLGAMENIVRRGRKRGLGCTLITQRPAVLNKNVLTQCEMLVAMRLVSHWDIKPIMEWVNVHADPKQAEKMIRSLPSLPIGTAWFWSPGWGDIFEIIKIRKTFTFDSSSTPKPGQKAVRPKAAAKIDLNKLGKEIAATIERAKADDPKQLKKRIAELERLAMAQSHPPRSAPITKSGPTEKEILRAAQVATKEEIEKHQKKIAAACEDFRSNIFTTINTAVGRLINDITKMKFSPPLLNARSPIPKIKLEKSQRSEEKGATVAHISPGRTNLHHPAPFCTIKGSPVQRILDSLAWWESAGINAPSREQTAFAARYSANSGHFSNMLGGMRTEGLVDYPSPNTVCLTDPGRKQAAAPQSILDFDALVQSVSSVLRSQPLQRIFQAVIEKKEASREDIATAAGYSSTSGHFGNMLGKLNTLGVTECPRSKPGYVILGKMFEIFT